MYDSDEAIGRQWYLDKVRGEVAVVHGNTDIVYTKLNDVLNSLSDKEKALDLLDSINIYSIEEKQNYLFQAFLLASDLCDEIENCDLLFTVVPNTVSVYEWLCDMLENVVYNGSYTNVMITKDIAEPEVMVKKLESNIKILKHFHSSPVLETTRTILSLIHRYMEA